MGNSSSRKAAELAEEFAERDGMDEVSQMLQAYAGDEPTLNMSTITLGSRTNLTSCENESVHMDNSSDRKKRKIPTVFRWHGKHCREVMISGSFNEWRTRLPLVRSRENFFTIVDLEEGRHEYKFYVDGSWKHDERTTTIANPHGTLNNVIEVRDIDLDVFEALATESNKSIEKPTHYSTDVPTRKWIEEAGSGPAVLPPHLLEVLLNQDTAVKCEPGMLPKPAHVVLNHVYALAIREGVIVLCVTHRFRSKYVTSLFYKPLQLPPNRKASQVSQTSQRN